jgi:hypothetical protein
MFHIVERDGWFYVLDEDGCDFEYSGPWRYRPDAQEYADELNGTLGQTGPEEHKP